jgi:hypothetical protein
MLKFIAVKARTPAIASDVKSKLRRFGVHASSVWPNKISLHERPDLNAFLFAIENYSSAGFHKEYSREIGNSVLVFDGLPYFEGVDKKDIIGSLAYHIANYPEDELLEKVFGSWSFCWFGRHRCYALSDFTGMAPIYSLETPDFSAISNRQLFLGVARDGDAIRLNTLSASWQIGQGSHFGEDMLVAGVRQVPPAATAQIDFDASVPTVKIKRRDLMTPARELAEDFDEREANGLVDAFVAQMNALAGVLNGDVRLDITGGLDSRTIAALAVSSNLKKRVSHFQTSGPEGSREVEIGAYLAKKISIEHSARVQKKASFDFASMLRQLRMQTFKYEGMICPTDGWSGTSPKSDITIAGAAGEIFRRHCKPHMNVRLTTATDVFRTYASYQGPLDPLKIQREEISAAQKDMLRSMAFRWLDYEADANDISDLFFLQNRLPHWNGVIFNNLRSSIRVTPLANYRAAKLAFRTKFDHRLQDRYHFELMSRLRPDLACEPFLDNQWSDAVRVLAARRGLSVAEKPFVSTSKKTLADLIPVGWFLWENCRPQISTYVEEHWNPGCDRIFNRPTVQTLLNTENARPPGITGIKALVSLIAVVGLLSSDYEHEMDGDTSIPANVNGNARALFGKEQLEYRDVAESRLSFHLN